ncbi:AMP-binding protein [Kibdelosporangium persicum]|uniref:AMP-dependent synthetase and ligase n=1 Tax=Kibdelosporangium persicum TaxID=2698649 RepID=A0ABX2FB46_9PSEU|nr:AMP-binding protein [Kibdelosporangium persicum]NRN68606.1 AMP-dependent synthetase and ligase [Kibdelosporangium persicum]
MSEAPRNVSDLVANAAERVPDRLAFAEAATDNAVSWAKLDNAVNAEARRLLDADVQPGDRVAIQLPTGIGFVIALFGAIRAGAVAVPMAADLPGRERERILEDSRPKVVTDQAPDLNASADLVRGAPGGEDIALLCYTSGTAGTPRGVMLSHRALLANVEQCASLKPAPVSSTDRVLLAVPLFHAYGLGPGLFQVASAGASGVLMDHFSVEPALRACEDFRITVIVGVPPMYQAFAQVPAERLAGALSTLRLLTSGAAPLEPSVLTAMNRATGLNVYEGYGLTETGPVLTWTLVGGVAKPGSVGRPLPGVELRLVDSDGTPGGDDEDEDAGVVSVRGPNLFSGYWPDGAHGPDAEGWFRTGDVGYLDNDGDLHLVDRANDLIIVNGFNVYPHEVEQVLGELTEVAEAAAVGIPDERSGERVKAVLVLREGAELTEDQVRDHCAARLAKFKVPGLVEFVTALPHSITGKLRRASLRKADSV